MVPCESSIEVPSQASSLFLLIKFLEYKVFQTINLIVSVESLYSRYFTFMSAISLVSLAILEDVVISASGKDNQGTYEQNRSGDM